MRGDASRWDRSEGLDDHVGAVVLLVLVAGLLFGGFVFWRTSLPVQAPKVDVLGAQAESRPASRPGSGYPAALAPQPAQAQGPAAVADQPAVAEAQPTAQAAPAATPAPTGVAHVAHTDGVGVVLRSAPKDDAWTPRGFMDGAEVTVLERQGQDWAHIRGANGQEGWVPAKYLTQ
jgi:Bacterial SH3 domain